MAKFSTVHDADDHTGVTGLFTAVATDHDAHDHTGVPGVGGGSGSVASASATYTGGNITTTTPAGNKIAVSSTNLDVTVAAVAGDILEYTVAMVVGNTSAGELRFDGVTIVSAAFTNYLSGGTATTGAMSGLYSVPSEGTASKASTIHYTVQAGDISGGNVTVRLVYNPAANAKTIFAQTNYPIQVTLKNLGQ